jgi:hypothetical protein
MQVIIKIEPIHGPSIIIGPSTKAEAVRWLRKNKFKKIRSKNIEKPYDIWARNYCPLIFCKNEKRIDGQDSVGYVEVHKIRPLENTSFKCPNM